MPLRFNHIEVTLPRGELARWRDRIAHFYGEVFGFQVEDVDLFDQRMLSLKADVDANQFVLVAEHDTPLRSPGYDHLGFLLESREEVDQKLLACRAWQKDDPAVEILEYDDLELPQTLTRAFYVRYGLPIWFDVQHIAYRDGHEPAWQWRYLRREQ